jgi:predicted unusual protein kinase regulating ubiquinone biosynthesis (AarF/ABC1/UbiB family)
MARFGLLTGELVLGGLAEGAKRFASSGPAGLASAFLSKDNARRLARRLSHMRGAAMKLGQLLSLEGEDLLPREFAEALAVLRAAADTMPVSQVRRILGRDYGKGWEARFDEFDFEPIAAASIGQVHYARARDGRELALKIQYPGIARSINSDVDNVALLLQLARILPLDLDVSGLIREAKRQLRQEADYLQEASYLQRYQKLVTDEPRLRVPKVHDDLTTKRILAMDFVDAYPLEHLGEEGTPQGPRDTAGRLLEQLLFRELFEFGFMQTDPNFANYLFEPDAGQIVLLDLGSAREFSPAFVSRYARICRAIVSGDRTAVQAGAVDIGYLQPGDSEDHVRGVVDLILLVCEPLRHTGTYDFASSRLAARARDAGFDLALRRGYRRAPPPETVFLHRKLIGSFLLCARIGARVDVQPLILPFLEAP